MDNQSSAFLLLGFGVIFLLGLAADAIGARTRLPRVTLLLLLGFLVGPSCLGLLPAEMTLLFELVTEVALTMVGFLLGEKLVHVGRQGSLRVPFVLSVVLVVITAAVVFFGMLAAGVGVVAALLLAGISTATDPAATVDVVDEADAGDSFFGRLLLAVVAIDDAWGLVIFSLLLGLAGVAAGHGGDIWMSLGAAGREIGGALLLGAVLGLVHSLLTRRIGEGEGPVVLEAIGLVLLACGLAVLAEVSFILTAMAMGATGCLLGRRHEQPFHVIERIEKPFLVIFFVLAGGALDLGSLAGVGWVGGIYFLCRVTGRVLGGWFGGSHSEELDAATSRLAGVALLPQAGVALGMALISAKRFPEVGEMVLQVTIGTTVAFEILGPLVTRAVIGRVQRREEQGAVDK